MLKYLLYKKLTGILILLANSNPNKNMRQSRSIIRHLHHYDDYVMRSEIIPQVPVPVPQLNEYHTKVINFQPYRKSVSICTDCNGVGWKSCNDIGEINTIMNLQFKFVLCKKCNGTGFH
jgi:hypothetical protein